MLGSDGASCIRGFLERDALDGGFCAECWPDAHEKLDMGLCCRVVNGVFSRRLGRIVQLLIVEMMALVVLVASSGSTTNALARQMPGIFRRCSSCGLYSDYLGWLRR